MAEPLPTPHLAEDAPDDLPAESPDGVDLTLIRWTLSLTPLQRLELLQDWVDGLAELRLGRVADVVPSTKGCVMTLSCDLEAQSVGRG